MMQGQRENIPDLTGRDSVFCSFLNILRNLSRNVRSCPGFYGTHDDFSGMNGSFCSSPFFTTILFLST
jgi:hypothetical protein